MTTLPWTATPARALEAGGLLARSLSDGRRRGLVLDTGTRRSVGTDLRSVFLPWPPPSPTPALAKPAVCTALIALQASPTKEMAGELAGLPLTRREREAVRVCEGRAALGWAISRWPGLGDDLRVLFAGLEPEDPPASTEELLARARSRRNATEAGPVGRLLGELRVDHVRRPWRSREWRSGRLPWSSRDVRPQLSFVESVPVAGSGGYRNRDGRVPAGPEDDHPDQVLEDHTAGIPYDEWDVIRQSYRRNFVTVRERRIPPAQKALQQSAPDVAGWVARSPDRAWFRGLHDGTDIDVDAYSLDWATRRNDDEADHRHYAALRRVPRDVATAVLLDASTSLRAAAGRMMELQLDCANAISSALSDAREPHAVFAFSSDGRHRVQVDVLHSFTDHGPLRVGSGTLRPSGYTRLGAAIRHVTGRLLDIPARRRVLLAFGDGLPSDEAYEGGYAVADTVKAVGEAADAGVVFSYVGVGAVRNDPLGAALGPQLVRVKDRQELGRVLVGVHERLRA